MKVKIYNLKLILNYLFLSPEESKEIQSFKNTYYLNYCATR